MTDKTDVFAASEFEQAAKAGAFRQTGMIFRAIFASPVGKQIIVLVSILVAAILFNTYGQIVLNRWNKPFYDALSRRDLNDFLYQLGVWAGIVSTLLVLDVVQRWLTGNHEVPPARRSHARPARALDGAAACLLARDQRRPDGREPGPAHERGRAQALRSLDGPARWACSAPPSCWWASPACCGASRAISRSASATPTTAVPGFMLWAAISYALVGSLLSYVVGRSLIRRNADRYSREADLRFSLVRINEHVDGIALAEGEADERRRVEQHLGNVMTAPEAASRAASPTSPG